MDFMKTKNIDTVCYLCKIKSNQSSLSFRKTPLSRCDKILCSRCILLLHDKNDVIQYCDTCEKYHAMCNSFA